MSLNWREIDAVLEELSLPGSFIQEIVQPDFHNLYLMIFRPGEKFALRICLQTGRTRLHASNRRPRKPRTRQRFAQMLHSRIRGGHIERVRQINADRIVRMDVSRGGESTILWIRLWGGSGNLIVTEPDGTIVDSFYRRPKRKEVTGEHFMFEPDGEDPERDEKKRAFRNRWPNEINAGVDRLYGDQERDEERGKLEQRAGALLSKRVGAARKRIAAIENALGRTDEADRYQTIGDLLTANLYRIRKGETRVEVEDYSREGEKIAVELDPVLGPHENAQRYYNRAQRARRSRSALADELHQHEALLASSERHLAKLQELSIEELRAIATEGDSNQERNGASTPGLTFESNGFQILVGRNSRENDELLRRHVRGNDTWLHARDYPGGYVFVRSKAGKSIPLDVLLDAGTLAIHYSKAKPNGRADLFYTQVKYLRRAKDGPRGLVLPTQEKNIHVVVEPERVARLLGRGAN